MPLKFSKYIGTMIYKLSALISTFLFSSFVSAQTIDVLTVGTFHFNFPNLDVVKIEKGEQIDVTEDKYQQQLDAIVTQLSNFNPTHVVVEHAYAKREGLQESYQQYKRGTFSLPRSEVYQLGFRLANTNDLNQIYAVDAWGSNYENVELAIKDKEKTRSFAEFYKNNPDTHLRYTPTNPLYKSEGIAAELLALNDPQRIQDSLGNYLIGHFKYEFKEGDYFGVDFETGRWFNRNLRIFRNIQRIGAKPGDRVVVIYGAGHMNLLNTFFDASPEYHRVELSDYLLDAPES
jgi:hypothetical protein